jgi:hypothetical protein
MVVDELTDALMKRRAELVDMLENRNDSLQLEKQHQIYGAINEIDLFLQTMSFYEKNAVNRDMEPINLARPAETKGLFDSLFAGFKKKIVKNK